MALVELAWNPHRSSDPCFRWFLLILQCAISWYFELYLLILLGHLLLIKLATEKLRLETKLSFSFIHLEKTFTQSMTPCTTQIVLVSLGLNLYAKGVENFLALETGFVASSFLSPCRNVCWSTVDTARWYVPLEGCSSVPLLPEGTCSLLTRYHQRLSSNDAEAHRAHTQAWACRISPARFSFHPRELS